jgi:alginate O-acetyltransferase complex protein AlgI
MAAMLFPTATFAAFFACVYVAHLALRRSRTAWRWLMIAASFIFYSWFDHVLAGVLLAAVAVTYIGSRWAAAGRWRLTTAAAGTLIAGLIWIKYSTWLFGNPLGWHRLAPIGVAFIVIQAVGYLNDVRHNKISAGTFSETALFLCFFPQLVCGPVLRAAPFFEQIRGTWPPKTRPPGRACGLIACGFAKKAVVVGVLSSTYAPVSGNPTQFSGFDVALWLFAAVAIVWADVSSYADFAVGLALLLNIDIPQNFKQPLGSKTFLELWQRWQTTVYAWMKTYVYTPLAGAYPRRPARTVAAVMATFLISGIWHGPGWSFVAFGLCCGTLVSCSAARRAWYQKRRRIAPQRHGWRAVSAIAGIWISATLCVQLLLGAGFGDLTELSRALLHRWDELPATATPLVMTVIVVSYGTHFIPKTWRTHTNTLLDRLHPVAAATFLAFAVSAAASFGARGIAPYLYYGL